MPAHTLTYRPTASVSSLLTAHSSLFFTFSAKEKDAESGLSYFGSRYYSSDLSIWLSVDPMSDKYQSLSPYVYCADNPVKLVDPNGEDWYSVDDSGNISLYKKIEGSTVDHIVVLNRKGEARLDKNGALKKSSFFGRQLSQQVTKGTFENIKDENDYTLLDFGNDKSTAIGVFNILADNTNVEWGIVGYAEDGERYQVGSSHEKDREKAASEVARSFSQTGNLLLYNHSHTLLPTDNIYQSAAGGFPSTQKNLDVDFWNELLSGSPNAILGIRFRRNTEYYHNNPKE